MYVLYKTGYYNKNNYPYYNEYSITKLLFHVKQLKIKQIIYHPE